MKPEELKGYVIAEASVSKAKLLRDMEKRGYKKEEVEEAISRLLSSGELLEKRSGKSVSYSPPFPDIGSAIQRLLEGQERIESALGIYDGSFEASFDKFYRKVRDVAGIATLRDIRNAMNMEASDFYSSFQKISRKYKLSPGGEEGLIIDGNVWGVILGYA
ncbi:MAG: hypothetical protein ACP5T5_04230 [Thermoprotei archaeon]